MTLQTHFRKQSGAALIVGLLLLVVITVLAVSGMSTATTELAMARNDQNYENAFQAAETGLERFIDFTKNDFVGRDAAAAERDAPPQRTLCTFVIDADDADVWADEPIWHDGQVVGFVTSGGYAHYVDKSVALGLVPRNLAQAENAFEIEILGDRRPASLITDALLDPKGARMRG